MDDELIETLLDMVDDFARDINTLRARNTELEAVHTELHAKWDRQECTWCGQLQTLATVDHIEELEAALLGAQKTNGRLVVEKLHLKAAIHKLEVALREAVKRIPPGVPALGDSDE